MMRRQDMGDCHGDGHHVFPHLDRAAKRFIIVLLRALPPADHIQLSGYTCRGSDP